METHERHCELRLIVWGLIVWAAYTAAIKNFHCVPKLFKVADDEQG